MAKYLVWDLCQTIAPTAEQISVTTNKSYILYQKDYPIMFREISTENFVRKREDWRKTSLGVIVCSVVYALVMNVLYDRLPIRIINFHHWFMLILVVANFVLSFYVGKILSVCPVCHQMIPTTRGRHQSLREKPRFFGNGPLPDYCPHCGENFKQYKTFEFEQY